MRVPLFLTIAAVAAAEDPPRPVTTATAVSAPLERQLELTGTVTAHRRASLSSRTGGLIGKIQVDAGSEVTAGQVLMELDTELAGLTLERISIELEQAELELAEALRKVEEVRDLTRRGGFPRSEAESRETAAKVRESEVRRLQVQKKEQQEIIGRHQLVAPFAGVIGRKFAEEGEWVETGTPVVELVETGDLRLDVQAPQEAFARLDGEVRATAVLDAWPGRELDARILVRVPVKDPVSRTFLVRLEMTDPEDLASPGMSARVVFHSRGKVPTVQVPRDAVVRFPDGTAKVWTIEREGDRDVARSRPVKLGVELIGKIEVLEGVAGGATVVVRGNEGLREGQPVSKLDDGPSGDS
ncbi:efflux RND transporter periplasmic adaptor subunit [Luteolibacter marinus]|uniref:efflux RND transporter periplasmic adaptor subunit n=1 Tax=Luteolibacter marinus TaxID=2776705 RepID=UPI0018673ABD|nr:efflux RND transporter periplasmic adaptor subunit [Luteolibacter marinus]